tara:strand:- start:536 stop:823 length:288 start_codon:yes stop_codon:yes gene_type:complete
MIERYDGMPEVDLNGTPTGNIWSSKYKDFIRPDLEEIVEKYTPQAEKNVEVCYTCDRWIPTQRRCSECGCFMDVKDIVWKLFAINEGSPCPLNKW